MKIELIEIPNITIEEFAEANYLVMQVRERPVPEGDVARYYASFKGCWVREGSLNAGAFGNGATPKEAIANYAKRISLTVLVLDVSEPPYRNIQVPRLKGTS